MLYRVMNNIYVFCNGSTGVAALSRPHRGDRRLTHSVQYIGRVVGGIYSKQNCLSRSIVHLQRTIPNIAKASGLSVILELQRLHRGMWLVLSDVLVDSWPNQLHVVLDNDAVP